MAASTKKRRITPVGREIPGTVTIVIFILLFSGPPMFRIRDASDSLEGAIDYAVVLRLLVQIAGGLWVVYKWHERSRNGWGYLPFKLRLPQKLGLAAIACFSLSIFVSAGPALSAFKVCEMLVSLTFTAVFVEVYGMDKCLDNILLGSTLLCLVIAACVFVAPDLVLFTSETGAPRLRGELIAPTEIVAVFAMILLVSRSRKKSSIWYWLFLVFLGILVAFSLSRAAYVILAVFFAFYLWKLKKRVYTYSTAAAVLILFLFDLMPSLSAYRTSEGIFTLSDRLGLWAYLTAVTLQKSPWIGLGYFSASRVYGMEYAPDLGSAHSMFVEALVGGGILGFAAVVLLCFVLGIYAMRLLRLRGSRIAFTVSMMFAATLLFGSIGGDFGYGPLGVTFWSLSAMLSILHEYIRPSRANVMKGVTFRSPSPAS
jgi:O-antigen ligase